MNLDFSAMLVVLLLAGAANTAPLIAAKLLGARLAWPVDGGVRLRDGRPLFGASKTLRGILCGIALPALLAPPLGQPVTVGLAIGAAAMAGDLLSSFVKRRMGRVPSSQAMGLDQIPEVLLPTWIARAWFDLSLSEIAIIVAVFFVAELVLSKLLFRLNLRDRPY
jgi:CDP-archaeol synthase